MEVPREANASIKENIGRLTVYIREKLHIFAIYRLNSLPNRKIRILVSTKKTSPILT